MRILQSVLTIGGCYVCLKEGVLTMCGCYTICGWHVHFGTECVNSFWLLRVLKNVLTICGCCVY